MMYEAIFNVVKKWSVSNHHHVGIRHYGFPKNLTVLLNFDLVSIFMAIVVYTFPELNSEWQATTLK